MGSITATGAIYLTVTANTTTVTPGTMVKCAMTSVLSDCPCSNRGFDMPVNNRLRQLRTAQTSLFITCSFSVSTANPNKILSFQLKHFNAAGVAQHAERHNASLKISSGGDQEAGSINAFHTLEEGDYLELWGTNETDTSDFVMEHMELQLLGFTPLLS